MDITKCVLKDIQAEKLCSTPDKHHIQRCQNILNNLEGLTYEEFISTGHIMSRSHIIDRYPNIELRNDAVSVCRYLGGFCIQFVGIDDFFWNYHKDKDLTHVEKTLYNHIKNMTDEQ
jgi:hypothetical protein|tara:strand:- start:1024 stop:1374 length:351 start_codon:yes stop_codon:yes gene_type:complete